MAQNIKNQSGKEDNQKRHIVILIKDFLEYIYCVEELNTTEFTGKISKGIADALKTAESAKPAIVEGRIETGFEDLV